MYGQGMNVMHFTSKLDVSAAPAPQVDTVLSCTSSGIAYISNTAFTGVWEFDFYKDPGTALQLHFIAMTTNLGTNALRFALSSSESVSISERDGGSTLMGTDAGYINGDTWYRYRIERNSSVNEYFTGGQYAIRLSILGGAYSSWTVITVTTGTNPIEYNDELESLYFVFSVDSGDKIGNITINGVKKYCSDFTQTTGTYVCE